MILTQTVAMLVDAYRELNAKKMFWITLALSVIVVLAIAGVGINDQGLTILWWTISLKILNTSFISPAAFYKFVFTEFGFKLWLTWIATVLALISTASIIPDFVAGGSIELSLSKPVGRIRLFLTKYATGLLFVTLQVSLFSLACFLVIGLRGKQWEPAVFLAIPLVVLFFSYLFSVCALLGLITRSTIAALLLTILFWFVLFVSHTSEQGVLTFKVSADHRIAAVQKDIGALPDQVAKGKDRIASLEQVKPDETEDEKAKRLGLLATEQARQAGLEMRLQSKQANLKEYEDSRTTLASWHRALFAAKTILPKTAETMDVLGRGLISLDELAKFEGAQDERAEERRDRRQRARDAEPGASGREGGPDSGPEIAAAREVTRINRERSVWWVIGTSLAFEAFVLLVACAIFDRRDF